MLPAGGMTGAMPALMVELLVTALTGARSHAAGRKYGLPGYHRHDLAHRADQQGLKVSEVTMQKLEKIASKG